MKVTFAFDTSRRSFLLEPEDELEQLVIKEMAERADKGSTISLSRIETSGESLKSFKVEIKVNGK